MDLFSGCCGGDISNLRTCCHFRAGILIQFTPSFLCLLPQFYSRCLMHATCWNLSSRTGQGRMLQPQDTLGHWAATHRQTWFVICSILCCFWIHPLPLHAASMHYIHYVQANQTHTKHSSFGWINHIGQYSNAQQSAWLEVYPEVVWKQTIINQHCVMLTMFP